MALNLDQSTKQDYGRIEDGTYPARVAQVVDLGEQHDTIWMNGASKPQFYVVDAAGKNIKSADGFSKKTTEDTGHPVLMHKVQVNFEFPTERINVNGEDKPRFQGKEYNVTNTGALAKLVEALSPGSKSIADILGKECSVAIGSTSGGKAKVVSVSPIMKGMNVPELENPATVFDMDDPDMGMWANLPNWLQEKVKSATNYAGSELEKRLSDEKPQNMEDFDEDLPY